MLVKDVYPNLQPRYGQMEIRKAVTSDKNIRQMIAYSCVICQKKVLRYLFPETRGVDWHQEVLQGRTPEWLNKLL